MPGPNLRLQRARLELSRALAALAGAKRVRNAVKVQAAIVIQGARVAGTTTGNRATGNRATGNRVRTTREALRSAMNAVEHAQAAANAAARAYRTLQ